MSTWKPTEGMRRAELLVQVLETEAAAAESKISAVFRHRMVEQIGKVIDAALPAADPAAPLTTGYTNGGLHQTVVIPAASYRRDDEAVHAETEVEVEAAPPKAKAAKPAKSGKKPGKRGRPSKAELAARAAAQA